MRLIDADEIIAHVKKCEETGSITREESELIIDFIQNTPTCTESRQSAYWGIYG